MTVYARGYRPYAEGFGGPPPALVVFREGYATALRSRTMRRMRVLFMCLLFGFAATLYFAIGTIDWTSWLPQNRGKTAAQHSWFILRPIIESYYGITMILSALIAILAGAGLISDDLRTRALPLYLVRPLRPFDYALGKALVLPAVLVFVSLMPGPLFLLLVALWQPPGETWNFLTDHGDLAAAFVQSYLLASAAYAGVMLFLSSRTSRRSAVIGLAAATIFGGLMLYGLAAQMQGAVGRFLRVLGIPWDTLVPILRVTREENPHFRQALEKDIPPDPTLSAVVCAALLVLGLVAAWRRARSVEVAG